MATAKKQLDPMEAGLLALRSHNWTSFNINPKDTEVKIDLTNSGTMDCIWINASSYVITSVRNNKDSYYEDLEYFNRACTCALSLRGVSMTIPNFASASSIDNINSHSLEHLGVKRVLTLLCNSFPLTQLKLSKILTDPNVENWTIVSLFLQVIHAVVFANKQINFVHNMLFASNISLVDYAPVFSVNYGEASLLCFKYIAVICNYGHAQYSYLSDNGGIVHVPPDLKTGINLKGHISSDLYKFTANCLYIITETLLTIPRISKEFTVMADRQLIFQDFLKFYLGNDSHPSKMQNWPSNIAPYKSGKEFLIYINKCIVDKQYYLLRPVSENYGNIHLEDRTRISHVNTWYGLDLRCLVGSRLSPKVTDLVGRCLLGEEDNENELEFMHMCSHASHEAGELLKKGDITEVNIRQACLEYPFFLTITRQTYSKISSTEVFKNYANEVLNNILSTKLYQNTTIKDLF